MRADQALVHLNLVSSRTLAQALIKAGEVFVYQEQTHSWVVVKNSSQKMDVEKLKAFPHWIQIKKSSLNKYVSRAGLKLEGALEQLEINVKGLNVLDVGQSTGGFTDCLLQKGAEQVVGVDVGHDQLSESLRNHSQVLFFEGLNARQLGSQGEFFKFHRTMDLIVMDVSFISITLILNELLVFLKPNGCILSLVKPQFELDKQALNKNGVVAHVQDYELVESKIKSHCFKNNLKVLKYIESKIEGKNGNKEFFLWAKKATE
ncbi:MAG: TlyA family RNA methyltransferase [Bdellovibrionales bacterium]|nr:TlyA family RNA methyltransferase [Bdellovibrionales bacterium]